MLYQVESSAYPHRAETQLTHPEPSTAQKTVVHIYIEFEFRSAISFRAKRLRPPQPVCFAVLTKIEKVRRKVRNFERSKNRSQLGFSLRPPFSQDGRCVGA